MVYGQLYTTEYERRKWSLCNYVFLNIVRKGPVHRNPDILKTEPFCPFFLKKCAWTNSVYQSFPPGGDGGEGISEKIGGSVRLPVRRHVSRQWVFIEESDKISKFITEIQFRFLGFGDFKVPVVIEN